MTMCEVKGILEVKLYTLTDIYLYKQYSPQMHMYVFTVPEGVYS